MIPASLLSLLASQAGIDELPQMFNVLRGRDGDCRSQAGTSGIRETLSEQIPITGNATA